MTFLFSPPQINALSTFCAPSQRFSLTPINAGAFCARDTGRPSGNPCRFIDHGDGQGSRLISRNLDTLYSFPPRIAVISSCLGTTLDVPGASSMRVGNPSHPHTSGTSFPGRTAAPPRSQVFREQTGNFVARFLQVIDDTGILQNCDQVSNLLVANLLIGEKEIQQENTGFLRAFTSSLTLSQRNFCGIKPGSP